MSEEKSARRFDANRLLSLARPEAKALIFGTVALVIASGLTLAAPQFVKFIVDGVIEGQGRGAVDRAALLLLVIFLMVRSEKTATIPYAVGAYIGGAYWFTSSTSFANPAVTVARMFSDTFAGIEPGSVPGFVVAQLVAVVVAVALIRIMVPRSS